jgi:deoxyribonuclease IV
MHCFGSHVSVAGGLHLGVQRARDTGCQCIQVFTKNANAWKAKPLSDEAIAAWKTALEASGLVHPIAHSSYLINLATPEPLLQQKSIDALVVEWQRCELLGLEGLVLHPGAYTTCTQDKGLRRVVDGIVQAAQSVAPGQCRLLVENTAGQGTCLGHELKQLGWIIDQVRAALPSAADSLGVCLDTCHAFAAGYAIHTPSGFRDFAAELADALPADAVRALHLNDSKKPLGSRVDRHEHIGRGEIGLAGFRHVLEAPVLGSLPGYLETEKGTEPQSGRQWDEINLEVLRTLVA